MKIFKAGFYIGEMAYGWSGKELYRLPSVVKNRLYYPLKKLDMVKIGNNYGYRPGGKPKTIPQLKDMTGYFASPIKVNHIKSQDTPF